jgi:hypothetical protein
MKLPTRNEPPDPGRLIQEARVRREVDESSEAGVLRFIAQPRVRREVDE